MTLACAVAGHSPLNFCDKSIDSDLHGLWLPALARNNRSAGDTAVTQGVLCGLLWNQADLHRAGLTGTRRSLAAAETGRNLAVIWPGSAWFGG